MVKTAFQDMVKGSKMVKGINQAQAASKIQLVAGHLPCSCTTHHRIEACCRALGKLGGPPEVLASQDLGRDAACLALPSAQQARMHMLGLAQTRTCTE